ncbi:branched-chain amino acid aminotransferase, partial [Candidatus Peregrinibacteria bacterium CG10_big_fil_rev_8_21_14_0_10_44_7]
GILKGVTRGVVFELAGGAGIDICERPLTRHDLYNCDEAFLTNTSVGIIPLTEANFRAIGGGRPGPVTKRLIEYFGRLTMS